MKNIRRNKEKISQEGEKNHILIQVRPTRDEKITAELTQIKHQAQLQ